MEPSDFIDFNATNIVPLARVCALRKPARIVECGAGWYSTTLLGMYASAYGAKHVIYDSVPLWADLARRLSPTAEIRPFPEGWPDNLRTFHRDIRDIRPGLLFVDDARESVRRIQTTLDPVIADCCDIVAMHDWNPPYTGKLEDVQRVYQHVHVHRIVSKSTTIIMSRTVDLSFLGE